MTIIKNIKTDGELERFKAATGATGRFRLRGPRRNLREHQDASPEVATHGTLYHTKSQDTWFDPDKLGVSVWTHSGNIYKGDRFIFSRQEDALECLQSYLNKGWQGRMTEGVYQSSPNPQYALTGWKDGKPILRQLRDASDRSVRYTQRRESV